jgi:hypothetical protein
MPAMLLWPVLVPLGGPWNGWSGDDGPRWSLALLTNQHRTRLRTVCSTKSRTYLSQVNSPMLLF